MKIIPVSDPAFRPYGRVVEGYPLEGILEALKKTPLPAGTDYAMRLYFGQPEESLWEIAKRCHIAADAIREENDLPEDTLSEAQMLLIPNVK